VVEESGQVIEVRPGGVVVAVVRSSACQSCKAKQGCGQAVLGEWGNVDRQNAKNHFFIDAACILSGRRLLSGDIVRLGIPEDTVSRAALWMYIWPLLPAFLMLWVGSLLAWSEPLQLLLALAAGGMAVLLIRRRFTAADGDWSPRILSALTPPATVIASDSGGS